MKEHFENLVKFNIIELKEKNLLKEDEYKILENAQREFLDLLLQISQISRKLHKYKELLREEII